VIKINLIREGRAAVRGPAVSGAATSSRPPADVNNILIVALLLVGLLAGGGYWFTKFRTEKAKEAEVASQRVEAQKLDSIIKEVEQFQARKDSLQKRIDLIKQLKANQKGPVRLLDRISQDLPDLVWLDSMQLKGTTVSLAGRALNPTAVGLFVENIKADPMFDEPEVGEITRQSTAPPVFSFRMDFNFTYAPPATAAGTADSQPAAAPATTPAT
jgi:type IV pilus assembly protein PilN